MSTATAQLNNYRQSPRKVRLVADLIRGKTLEQAEYALQFADKKAALPLSKLLASAISNAKSLDLDTSKLVVREVSVNGGPIMYRQLPMARGRAFRLRKRTSKIVIVLGEKALKVKGGGKAIVAAKIEAPAAEAAPAKVAPVKKAAKAKAAPAKK